MRRSSNWASRLRLADESGSASLEFVTVGLIMLVPLVYLVLTVAAIQGAALAVEGAARQAVRVFVQGDSIADAQASAERAVEFALADHGIDPDAATITITCAPVPGECLTRRGFVTITIELSVPLPGVPAVLPGDFPLAVPIGATATEQVSRFWGAG